MDNCLQCGKPLVHVEGRRQKKYCNDICKREYWKANKPIQLENTVIPPWFFEVQKFCSEEQIKPAELISFYIKYKLVVNDIDFKPVEEVISHKIKEVSKPVQIGERKLIVRETIKRPEGLKGFPLKEWEKEKRAAGFLIIN